MDLSLAKCLIDEEMEKWLPSGEWSWEWSQSTREFGVCSWAGKRISMSKYLTRHNSQAEVRDTILHEIAHALAGPCGHSRKWKLWCIRVGARPVRCYTAEQVKKPTLKYKLMCLQCGTVIQYTNRVKPVYRTKTLYHRKCGKSSTGKVVYRENR